MASVSKQSSEEGCRQLSVYSDTLDGRTGDPGMASPLSLSGRKFDEGRRFTLEAKIKIKKKSVGFLLYCYSRFLLLSSVRTLILSGDICLRTFMNMEAYSC